MVRVLFASFITLLILACQAGAGDLRNAAEDRLILVSAAPGWSDRGIALGLTEASYAGDAGALRKDGELGGRLGRRPTTYRNDVFRHDAFPSPLTAHGPFGGLADRMSLRAHFVTEPAPVKVHWTGAEDGAGKFGATYLALRDATTGQVYRAATDEIDDDTSFVVNGDLAHVFETDFLPSGGAISPYSSPARTRAGLQWEGDGVSVFYGVSWRAHDVFPQPNAPMSGAISVNLRF